jgi:methyl-accepting chemotaxis protein
MAANSNSLLKFFGLSDDNWKHFSAIRKVVEKSSRPILNDFYDNVRKEPSAAKHFSSEGVIQNAQNAQINHWLALFSKPIDDKFVARARKVGDVHARIGLQTDLYFGAYSQVLGALVEQIVGHGHSGWFPGRKRQAKVAATLVRAALFDMNIAMGTVVETMLSQVASTALDVQASAAEITDSSRDLALRTENQANAVNETAASRLQFRAGVEQCSASTREIANLFESAHREATQGDVIVESAMQAMHEIEASSREIGQITDLIDGIAFQTNLLALNAGVEAARAGDAGRGFAVVASEVRALAQRTADAAQSIKSLIASSSQQVGSGVARVRQTSTALQTIVMRIEEILGLVQTVSTVSEKQAASIDSINISVQRIESTTQQNAAMAEEANALACTLSSKIASLSELAMKFSSDSGLGARAEGRERPQGVTSTRLAA